MSANRRLFVALWPDETTRAALVRARGRWTWSAAARPTPDDNLHVTLVFLGAVPAGCVAGLVDALPVAFEPFTLRLVRHALWGNGIAALEPVGPFPALATLHAALADRTTVLGFVPEARRFRPHVTLARDARGSAPPDGHDAIDWRIGEYALIESRAGRYAVLATWRR